MRYISCTVDEPHAGRPLWSVLEEQLHVSRALIRQAKIQPRGLLLDGEPTYTTAPVRAGQLVAIDVADHGESGPVEPQEGPLAILYEDLDYIAVEKPADQVVHPCPGHRSHTLGNFVLHYLAQGSSGCTALYPVHRLDRGTSGLLIYAKNAHAHQRLQATLHREGSAGGRIYLALCEGVLEKPMGIVDAPIVRPSPLSIRRAVGAEGQRAVTHYRTLGILKGRISALWLRLETGRTHQIRVHMAHLGHPLVGDTLYGGTAELLNRPALHSWRLDFVQPITGASVSLEAPIPGDLAPLLAELGAQRAAQAAPDHAWA